MEQAGDDPGRTEGPSTPCSTVLTAEQGKLLSLPSAKHTLLPLDDCLYALQATLPALTRSALHRCLERHGISRLPEMKATSQRRSRSSSPHPIGYFHVDIADVCTEEGKLRLFVAIDRTFQVRRCRVHPSAGKREAAPFLRNLIAAVPYKIHTLLTDNGIQFCHHERHRYAFQHIFDRVGVANGIEHRLTQINHPWTNGQVERMTPP